jgi:hypothetical protein
VIVCKLWNKGDMASVRGSKSCGDMPLPTACTGVAGRRGTRAEPRRERVRTVAVNRCRCHQAGSRPAALRGICGHQGRLIHSHGLFAAVGAVQMLPQLLALVQLCQRRERAAAALVSSSARSRARLAASCDDGLRRRRHGRRRAPRCALMHNCTCREPPCGVHQRRMVL